MVESLGVDTVLFLPDEYLAQMVASQTKVKIITWTGACEVHERFTGAEICAPTARPIPASRSSPTPSARRTCSPRPTSPARPPKMIDWVHEQPAGAGAAGHRVLDGRPTSQAEAPDIEFIRPCNLCPHMKRITLPKILDSLLDHDATRSPSTRWSPAKARRAVERMINLKS